MSNSDVVINKHEYEWTTDHEDILVEWADKAMCYRWLHSRAHAMFNRLNYAYTIPVIVISTLTGTANFAQDRVPVAYQGYYVMGIGFFNILAGIITTIQHPDERMTVNQLLKISKEEFDRLVETSPDIPDNIIAEFKTEFSEKFEYADIIKPELCGKLVSTEQCRNQWSTSDNIAKKKILKKQRDNKMKEYVVQFADAFSKINGREPTEGEIIDNLKDQLDISKLRDIIDIIQIEKPQIRATNDTQMVALQIDKV